MNLSVDEQLLVEVSWYQWGNMISWKRRIFAKTIHVLDYRKLAKYIILNGHVVIWGNKKCEKRAN